MARNGETGVPELAAPFHVDQSWYERYWFHDSAPRKPGILAFFRRILSQRRLAKRQGVRADHQIPHSTLRHASATPRVR